MAVFGITVLKKNTLDYIEYHGHKRSIKSWVVGLGESWEQHFTNVPFGELKLNGVPLKPGYIVRKSPGKFIFETEANFKEKYIKI